MPFYRPTREQIRRRVQSDFLYAFGNDAVLYPGTIEHAFCEAIVGDSHAIHGRIDQIYRDAFPHLASEGGVRKWASFFNIFLNKATYAEGTAFAQASGPGVLAKGAIIVRDDGFEYVSTEDVPHGGGMAVPVKAKVPGAAGNFPEGLMAFQSALPNLFSSVEVFIGTPITGGADVEAIAALRTRLLAALASPTGGGQKGDYVRWAKMVTGVTRAWEYGCVPKLGDVTTLIMRDLDADPFPNPAACAEVQAMQSLFAPIMLPPPTVQSPINEPLFLSIDLTIEPGAVLADVKDAIAKSIQDMLATRVEPPSVDGTVLYRSWISEAISAAVGELDHKLLLPVADVPIVKWGLPTLLDPVAQIGWP